MPYIIESKKIRQLLKSISDNSEISKAEIIEAIKDILISEEFIDEDLDSLKKSVAAQRNIGIRYDN